jgi:hypothetical protein
MFLKFGEGCSMIGQEEDARKGVDFAWILLYHWAVIGRVHLGGTMPSGVWNLFYNFFSFSLPLITFCLFPYIAYIVPYKNPFDGYGFKFKTQEQSFILLLYLFLSYLNKWMLILIFSEKMVHPCGIEILIRFLEERPWEEFLFTTSKESIFFSVVWFYVG